MTGLRDHAKRGDGPEVVLTSDLPQRPASRLLSTDLVDHDDLTEEGLFPEHGSFLEMETPDGETEYWECSGSLASAVVEVADELEVELGSATISVDQVSKTPSGEWRFVVDVSEAA